MHVGNESFLEVRYYETDMMSIVHHSNYVRYFEYGRCSLMKEMGMPIEEIEKRGFMMPVVDVYIKYKKTSTMGDVLRIVSTLDKEPMAKTYINTKIFNQNNELVCLGTVTLGFIHKDTRKPCRAPKFYLDALASVDTERKNLNN
ncbi:MAG: thioesterase family protein [Bacteroidales bacterium]